MIGMMDSSCWARTTSRAGRRGAPAEAFLARGVAAPLEIAPDARHAPRATRRAPLEIVPDCAVSGAGPGAFSRSGCSDALRGSG